MTLDINMIIGMSFTVLSGVSVYLFTVSQDHEKRIQKVEDVYTRETEKLIASVEDLKKQLAELTAYVHQKMHDDVNQRSYTDKIIDLMYKKIFKEDEII
jgi:hypothetical protein